MIMPTIKRLKRSNIALPLAICIISGLLIHAWIKVYQANLNFSMLNNSMQQQRQSAAALEESLQDAAQFMQPYQDLISQNFIVTRDRQPRNPLQRDEFMELLREQYPIPEFSYAMQAVQSRPPPPELKQFSFQEQGMNLHLKVQHEIQLSDFWNALHANAPEFFRLSHCKLQRHENLLDVACSGNWTRLISQAEK